MTKNVALKLEEEDECCESSRGKESKFVAERSGDSGTNADSAGANSSSGGSGIADSAGSDAKADSRERNGRGRYRIPSNFCRDFIFHTCKRRGCKFEHPDPDSNEYKDARASRPDIGSRERERSRSPNHETDPGKPAVCRDYLRNMCYRGSDCRFLHPQDSGEKEELPWPQLCIDYRAGTCKRIDCRFLHYNLEDEQHYMMTGTVRKELWQNFINLTLRDPKLLRNRPVCKQYLRSNECTMEGCRFRHVSRTEYDDEMYQVITQMVYEKCCRVNRDRPPLPNDCPPRDGGDMPPPPGPMAAGGPPSRGPAMSGHYGAGESDLRSSMGPRRDYDWQHCSPYGSYGKQSDPGMGGGPLVSPMPGPIGGGMDVDQLSRENMDLRRMINEDSSRYKLDVDRLNMENAKLMEQLSYLKTSGGGGQQQQQFAALQSENAEYAAKVKTMNDMSVELQAKYSTTRRECDELRDSVKVLNLELATVNEEKVKQQRKADELEAKLQVALNSKESANLAVEKKEYLETKLKQYYEGMKRCESEIVLTLEKNFNITTPNVMSYFPTWGYLVSFITEIVTQINSSSSNQGYVGAPPGFASFTASAAAAQSNYSVPPPSVSATALAPSSSLTLPSAGYGYGQQDFSQQQQHYSNAPSQHQSFGSTSNSAAGAGYYGSGGHGAYGSGSMSYSGGAYAASANSYGNAAAAAPVLASSDDGRSGGGSGGGGNSGKSSGKKDSYMNSSPWKKRS